MKDNCNKCKIKRNNSSRSCQSNSVNTAVTSLSISKDEKSKDDQQDQLEGLKFLAERDMRSLHKHIPALGRKDVQISAIRQHYYPEGGWGWVVVFSSLLAHCLTTGNLLAGGSVAFQLKNHFKTSMMASLWAPLLAWSISLSVAPLVTHICRQYSVRLVAVVGGLVLNMAFLFASFGSQLHQIVLSYGLLLGATSGAVRETCSIMLGQYFKTRRLLVEMFVSCGSGLGIILFSVLYRESVRSLGWRLGLQSLQGVFIIAFFLGLFYRSASLYHPQRDAISHIKHQKEKVKSKSFNESMRARKKFKIVDLSILMQPDIRICMGSLALTAGGIYTPIFTLPLHLESEGDEEHIALLGVWLGLATLCGSLGGGLLILHSSSGFYISKQLLLQASIFGAGLAVFALYIVKGLYGYLLACVLYGFCLGVFLYISKVLCYFLVSTKEFSRVWSCMEAAQAIPVLLGVSISGYINESYGKPGYWFSLLLIISGGTLLSFLPAVEIGPLQLQPEEQEEDEMVRVPDLANLADLADFNNVSMSCNSKMDRFMAPQDKLENRGNLRRLSAFSYSDPENLSEKKHKSSIHFERHNSLDFTYSGVYGDENLNNRKEVRGVTAKAEALWRTSERAGERDRDTWREMERGESTRAPLRDREREGVRLIERERDILVIDQITSTV